MKFLVIDDLRERKTSYEEVFNFVELDFAYTKEEFVDKIKEKYDGYFVDILYDPQSFEDYSFQQILQNIPEKKPLFLISSQWDKAIDQDKMRALCASGKYNDVLGYLSWFTINEQNKAEFVRDFAKEQIYHYYSKAYKAFDKNQNISILQISDIEFGNPNQVSKVDTEGAKIINKVRKHLRKLDINDTKVDFICICGDIAYLGDKKQYVDANIWLKYLGEQLLINKNFENMIIVPGNHDYNFNAAAGNFLEYDKKTKEYTKREKDCELEFNEHGMYNFARFVYELNGDASYLLNPYMPIIKRTYEDYGLNFILLNPIKTNQNGNFVCNLDDNAMKTLIEAGINMDEGICSIILSHFAPDKYEMRDKTSDAIDRNIKEISNALNLKGWFYGHAHEDDYIDDKMLGNHKVLHARSQSLMLENGQHCEESRNGFNLFKLTRNEGKVTNISYYDEVNKRVQDFPNLFKEN